MRVTGLSMVLAVSVLGCGGSTPLGGTDAGAGNDAATGVDSGTDGGGPGADAGDPCAYVDAIDRTCSTDADCAIGLHQINCCGSSVMIGYRSTQTGVPASESACMASYPGCGCPAMLPTTDSGETVTDTGAVQVACVTVGPTAVCRTYVTMRPPNGR